MNPRIKLLQSFAEPCSRICKDYFLKEAKTWRKQDKSFVSEADIKVNDYIISSIQEDFADDAILSEESPEDPRRKHSEYTWIIDPIDGTSEFLAGSPEFCIMICILRNNKPFYASITIPQENKSYEGGPSFSAKEKDLLSRKYTNLEKNLPGNNILIMSKSRATQQLKDFAKQENIESFSCGSAGVKACRILQHKANNYIHMSKIAEWDTAAPDCILQSWGQGFIDIDGNALIYNKENFYHKHFFYMPSEKLFLKAKKFFQKN
jgi:3'(2'), 5'-bisphosphate nucleotidase